VSVFRIPLVALPQSFDITLAGRLLSMACRWNGAAPAWELSIADGDTGEPLISSLAIVTGTNLFSQYAHLNFGGALVAMTDGDLNTPPTLTNLGVDSFVYFITAASA
jgi:hypothetical protein